MANADDHFDTQPGSAGIPAGPRLKSSLFIPSGLGIVWTDANGNRWQQTVVLDDNGNPTLQLQQVSV